MDASCYLCSQNVDSGTWKKKRIRLDRVGPGIEAVRTMNYILSRILCINPVNIPDVTYLCHKCKNDLACFEEEERKRDQLVNKVKRKV